MLILSRLAVGAILDVVVVAVGGEAAADAVAAAVE